MATGSARPDDVRRQNRRAILQAVRTTGAISRTDLCSVSGLSQASVSAITTSMISSGILREANGKSGLKQRRGRPQVFLKADASAGLVGALSLTVNGLAIALVDYSGQTLSSGFCGMETLEMSSTEILGCIVANLRQMIDQSSSSDVPLRHITFGIQGVTDSDFSRVLWSPIMRERDVEFRDAMSNAFGVPVTVDNDCNLIAEALRWSSEFPFQDDFAALHLGHGIGMGLYLGGARFHGTLSSAGEFGHMLFRPGGRKCRCGALGCIEAYASDYAVIGSAHPQMLENALRGDLPASSYGDLADAARNGDQAAIDAFRTAGEALGSGLASLFSITDPIPVAFVGKGTDALDLIEPTIIDVLETASVRNFQGELVTRTFPDEKQLVLDGCRMTSLRYLDAEIFAQSNSQEMMEGQPV